MIEYNNSIYYYNENIKNYLLQIDIIKNCIYNDVNYMDTIFKSV